MVSTPSSRPFLLFIVLSSSTAVSLFCSSLYIYIYISFPHLPVPLHSFLHIHLHLSAFGSSPSTSVCLWLVSIYICLAFGLSPSTYFSFYSSQATYSSFLDVIRLTYTLFFAIFEGDLGFYHALESLFISPPESHLPNNPCSSSSRLAAPSSPSPLRALPHLPRAHNHFPKSY